MYLIWRMDTTAKGAKKNTSPNVIHLQYLNLNYPLPLFKQLPHTKVSWGWYNSNYTLI